MTRSNSIIVAFDWQPGEHAEVVQILSRRQFRSAGWRAAKWGVGLVGAGWLVLAVVNMVLYGDSSLLFAGFPWALFVAFWYWILSRSMGSAAARQTSNLNADVHYPFVHEFDETGLSIKGFTQSVGLKWDGMSEVREEDGFFMFFWNPKCAYFTPKRVMSIEDQNRLRALVQRKLGGEARVRAQIPPLTTEDRS